MKPEYRLPFPEFIEKRISRPTGKYAHENFPASRYAIDFLLDVDTPILAARDGKVDKIRSNSSRYFQPNDVAHLHISEIERLANEHTNLVVIDHGDGTSAEYIHFRKYGVKVELGQTVKVGDLLGYSGLSGIMDVPHLHFNVFKKPKSIPVEFFEPKKK